MPTCPAKPPAASMQHAHVAQANLDRLDARCRSQSSSIGGPQVQLGLTRFGGLFVDLTGYVSVMTGCMSAS